jgi:hypothetical protein
MSDAKARRKAIETAARELFVEARRLADEVGNIVSASLAAGDTRQMDVVVKTLAETNRKFGELATAVKTEGKSS